MSLGRNNQQSTGTSTQSVYQPQGQAFTDLLSRAQDFSNQGTFLGPTEAQQLGQQSGLQAAQNLGQIGQQAGGAASFLLGGGAFNNPFLEQSAQSAIRPIFENLQRNVLPGIGSEAIGAGQYGGSRQGIAEGLAAQGALQSAGDVTGNMYSNAYGQGLQALQNTFSNLPNVQQSVLGQSNVLRDIGGEQRGFQQEQMLDPYIQLQRLRDLIGPLTTLTDSQQSGSGSGWNLGLGSANVEL